MAIALDPKRVREYVLKAERALPVEEQTVFLLRALTVYDRAELADAYTKDHLAKRLIEMVRFTLAGWRNFKRADGTEAPFTLDSAGRPTVECVEQIAQPIMSELVGESLGIEEITPAEVGKS